MRNRLLLLLFSLGGFLLFLLPGADRLAAQTDSCVSSQCHSTMGKDRFVHNPVKEGMCTTCHQAVSDPGKAGKHPGNLTITLTQQGADLCYNCHEAKNKKKVVHAPIQGGDCTTCHNPHQSPHKAMLRNAQPQLCFQCHPDSIAKHKTTHKPVAEGNCSACHDNHESDLPGRTLREGNALCLGCHGGMEKDMKTSTSVHPAAAQGCTQCHSHHGSENRAMLAAPEPTLCYQCHEAKDRRKVVHSPVKGGDCTSCHNPHYSAQKGMLKDAVPRLCFQCHPETMMKQAVMHPPVAAGDCSGCHDNHASDYPGRTLQAGNALCFMCHTEKADAQKTKKVAHQPVQQSCIQCHDQHGSSQKALLSAPVPDLCANCHPNEVTMRQKALVKHGPMNDAKMCRNCHDPHYADQPRLLVTAQMALCLACHNRELETPHGKIANMKAHLEANRNGHGPVKSSDCVSCHNPHGSDYWRILAKYYPPDFYTAYSDGKYGLCYSCHDKEAFTDRFTVKATKFRDGDRNLHFIHVNKAAKGRTCRACHEVHADAGQYAHVKQSVGFSYWTMPMNFIPSKNGGTCAPGCHGEKRYAR